MLVAKTAYFPQRQIPAENFPSLFPSWQGSFRSSSGGSQESSFLASPHGDGRRNTDALAIEASAPI